MSKTKQQWYDSFNSWLPQWWFQTVENQEAILFGICAVLERLDGSLQEHVEETFITMAESGYLDEHGLERNLNRFPGELDPPFSDRIRNIVNSTNYAALKALVDALLDVGEATLIEDYNNQLFLNREAFYNRGYLLITAIYNAFSIIVDRQVHAPYSFYTREYFYTRENFTGTNESSIELFQNIVEAVNAAKAFGTVYRLIERIE